VQKGITHSSCRRTSRIVNRHLFVIMDTTSTSEVNSDETKTANEKPKSSDCDNCSMSNTAPKIDRHIILCHSSSNWPSKIEEEEGAIAVEFCRLLEIAQPASKISVKLTACDEPTINDVAENSESTDVLIYPEALRFNISRDYLQVFVDSVLSDDFIEMAASHGLVGRPLGWDRAIFVCIHAARDKV
jgi:hypothetical protein